MSHDSKVYYELMSSMAKKFHTSLEIQFRVAQPEAAYLSTDCIQDFFYGEGCGDANVLITCMILHTQGA